MYRSIEFAKSMYTHIYVYVVCVRMSCTDMLCSGRLIVIVIVTVALITTNTNCSNSNSNDNTDSSDNKQ